MPRITQATAITNVQSWAKVITIHMAPNSPAIITRSSIDEGMENPSFDFSLVTPMKNRKNSTANTYDTIFIVPLLPRSASQSNSTETLMMNISSMTKKTMAQTPMV